MSRDKTGGNLEPMPFVRRWGSTTVQEEEGNGQEREVEANLYAGVGDVAAADFETVSPKKHRRRERSKSPSKRERKRSHTPEKKRHKKRSRSREGKSKKRSSRSRSRDRSSRKAERAEAADISAFPPPAEYLQQVHQQRQQQMEMLHAQQQQQSAMNFHHQQQQSSAPYSQFNIKQELLDYNNQMPPPPQPLMQQQQGWNQSRPVPPPPQMSETQQQKPGQKKSGGDSALSAALAAAAMVAQKLNRNESGGAAPNDLLNRGSTRLTGLAEAILSKDQPDIKREFDGQEFDEGGGEPAGGRRRKSRWSNTKSFVPGMPTILPADIDETQRQIYLLQMDVEETTRRLRQGDFGQNVDPAERSPSPEPVYDTTGKRLNTREIRKRQELEQRRHEKIQALLRLNPNYKPPTDYRPPNIKLHDKVWIPQEDHPEINFVGLLIGPRGNTLKALEAETGCKIIIRGKGSIKEGKLGTRAGPLPGENEPLHAYVTATDKEAIKRGCEKIREIVNAALMIPDGQNELRKLQLRELALLNGTLRPEDVLSGARCGNCGSDQHKTWECMEAPNVTANVICTACGGAGHIAKDCKHPKMVLDPAMIDSEYSALMAELGEKQPAAALASGKQPTFLPAPTIGANKMVMPLGAFAAPPMRPRFALPPPTPIVRVNLAKPQQSSPRPPTGYNAWAIESPSAYYGFSGLPGQDPAAAAAAWAAWQGYPSPVPPPPSASGGVGAPSSGLAMFPPPPPPPPPVPKVEVKEEFGAIFSAPPPPS